MKPLHDNVLIKPDADEEIKTSKGIVLLKKQQQYLTGEVVAIGKGKPWKNSSQLIPVGVKVGERVAYQGRLAETPDGLHLVNQGMIWWIEK